MRLLLALLFALALAAPATAATMTTSPDVTTGSVPAGDIDVTVEFAAPEYPSQVTIALLEWDERDGWVLINYFNHDDPGQTVEDTISAPWPGHYRLRVTYKINGGPTINGPSVDFDAT